MMSTQDELRRAAQEGNMDRVLELARRIEDERKAAAALAAQELARKRGYACTILERRFREKFLSEQEVSDLSGLGKMLVCTFSFDEKLVTCSLTNRESPKVRVHENGAQERAGKRVRLYGKSLAELFADVATPSEKTKLSQITGNSKTYAFKAKVVDAAVGCGKIVPITPA